MIVSTKTGVLVTGTVSREPELKHVGQYNRAVLKMSVRCASETGDDGKAKGIFVDVDVWNNAEKLDGMFCKDDFVMAVGKELKSRPYNGKTYYSVSAEGVFLDAGVTFRWAQQIIDMIPAAPAAPVNIPQGFQPVGESVPFDTFERPAASDAAAAGDPNTDFIDDEAEDLPF